jgi:hypothetical protein
VRIDVGEDAPQLTSSPARLSARPLLTGRDVDLVCRLRDDGAEIVDADALLTQSGALVRRLEQVIGT